jgi:hypothetical protein
MLSKFPGTCRDCGERVSRGSEIVYHGKGNGISCAACAESEGPRFADEDDAAGLESGTLASDRRLARNGLTVVRTSSGWSGTRNSRGRCEDAPCCGCCTI